VRAAVELGAVVEEQLWLAEFGAAAEEQLRRAGGGLIRERGRGSDRARGGGKRRNRGHRVGGGATAKKDAEKRAPAALLELGRLRAGAVSRLDSLIDQFRRLVLLRRILDPQCASADKAGELLARMVTGLVTELCSFKIMESFPAVDVGKHARDRSIPAEAAARCQHLRPPARGRGSGRRRHCEQDRPCAGRPGERESGAAGDVVVGVDSFSLP